jgi:hypothetical protein
MQCPEELGVHLCLPYSINTLFVPISPTIAILHAICLRQISITLEHQESSLTISILGHIVSLSTSCFARDPYRLTKSLLIHGLHSTPKRLQAFFLSQVFDFAINYLYKGSSVFLHLSLLLIFRSLPFRGNIVNYI